MPYPSQVNKDELLETAWALAEKDGPQNLTLSHLAAQFGVKAPSLYRYIRNKAALIRAVNEQTETMLFRALDAAQVRSDDPYTQLIDMADAYWDFALTHPRVYALAFTTSDPEQRPDPIYQVHAVQPIQAIMAHISGEAQSLAALRGIIALMHGFVMLVIHQQLRRGGDLQAAYRQSVRAYLAGWQRDG